MQDTSEQLVSLIRELIREELQNTDSTVICKVESVNADGSANIYVLPDVNNLIRNIPNSSNTAVKSGDIVVLFKIKNKLNNSFIIANYSRTAT